MRISSAALLLLLAGCGSGEAVRDKVGAPAPTTAVSPALRACETGETAVPNGCFDADALRRSNRAFRDRITPIPADLARAQAALPAVRAALAPTRRDPTVEAVTVALKAAGLPGYGVPSNAVVGVPADGVGVSVEYGSACVFGSVTPTAVQLDVGGVTKEGSCLPGIGGH